MLDVASRAEAISKAFSAYDPDPLIWAKEVKKHAEKGAKKATNAEQELTRIQCRREGAELLVKEVKEWESSLFGVNSPFPEKTLQKLCDHAADISDEEEEAQETYNYWRDYTYSLFQIADMIANGIIDWEMEQFLAPFIEREDEEEV